MIREDIYFGASGVVVIEVIYCCSSSFQKMLSLISGRYFSTLLKYCISCLLSPVFSGVGGPSIVVIILHLCVIHCVCFCVCTFVCL